MKRKIKVGIFVDGDFIPSYDGASNRFHYLSRHLVSSGANVVLFHGYRKWSDISLIKKEPFKTYVFPIEQYYGNLDLIASLIRKESVDIIQFDNLEPILLQGVHLSKASGTKLVGEMHYVVRDLAERLGASRTRINEIKKMEKAVGASVDHLIALSYADKMLLEKNMKVPTEKISVIPSGVDCKEIKYIGPEFESKNIVFLGNLYFKPNEDAVRAMRESVYPELERRGFKFTIAGDCPPELKRDCETERFNFIGTLPDLNRLFKGATFAIAPINVGTGMRIKFLNYLAAGIPILTTDVATSGFEDKRCFFIEDDYSAYARKIEFLMNDREKLIRISQQGRSQIEKSYDWNVVAGKAIETYERVRSTPCKSAPSRPCILKNKEPVWLQEAIAKKRFQVINSAELPKEFSYSVLDKGKTRVSKVKKIIALEGMPGAGKTTFIEKYVKDKNTVFVPQIQINEALLCKDDLTVSIQLLLAEEKKTEQINELESVHSEILLDRTFFTTLAYCYARSKIQSTSQEYASLLRIYEEIKYLITFPTQVLYLDVSIQESIIRRIGYAKDNRYNRWFDPAFLGYFKEFYETEFMKFFFVPLLRVDTTDMDQGEVSGAIKKVLCETV